MSDPYILISRQEDISSEAIEEFTEDLSRLSIPFKTEQTGRGIYNGIEHYLPTALVVLIAKPFFDAFLKKAGEDAYVLFKRSLAALIAKAAKLRVQVISAGKEKVSQQSEFSRAVSIYAKTATGVTVKFLMPAEGSEGEYRQAVDSMLLLVGRNHLEAPGDELSLILAGSDSPLLKVLRYNIPSGSWHLLDLDYVSKTRSS